MGGLLGWAEPEGGALQLFTPKCSLFGSASKGEMCKNLSCRLVSSEPESFWRFCFSKIDRSPLLCVSSHTVGSLKGDKNFLNCIPYIGGSALEKNILALRESRVLTNVKTHLAFNLSLLLE